MDDTIASPPAFSGIVAFPVTKTVVAATVAGNALEFYDFVTYAFFAVYIGRPSFPLPPLLPACCCRWRCSASALSSARSEPC